MCSCDGPMPVVYTSIVRKAAKPHQCSECHQQIIAGQYYESASGLWDGRWSNYKTCARCAQLRDLITEESDCYCFSHGGLHEEVTDYDYPGLVRRLTATEPGLGFTYRLYRANACSLRHAEQSPKLYGRALA